ncbi:glycosyltransferase family 4 protein [Aerosakkonema sp. BLCC-F183]|uniref:glycosyltransferase family 4 protein n=1 Tax=Aerosakkonema sp. BLCC-F183 TaxID=3342834 RepID=UPI0035BB5A21
MRHFNLWGGYFGKHNIPWILETNAPLFSESKQQRKTIVLSKIARYLELRAYQQCNVLVCISSDLKQIIVREMGISPSKIIVIPNGVDVEIFDPARYQPKRLFPNFTIGYVGSLYAWQGLNFLLEAIADLRTEGLDLSLLVVGDGPMQKTCQELVHRLNIAPHVAFVDRIPASEVPAYIAGFDVGYCGQVELETGKIYFSPLKLYEYMAMGKPVIASAFEDTIRVIRDGETGFLFQAGNLPQLKQAISKAYREREHLVTRGRLAREQIVTNHSWNVRVQLMIAEVDRILKASKQ